VEGRSSGAPPEACGIDTDIVPDHRYSPSTSSLPYSVDLSGFSNNKYKPGQSYTSECVLCVYYVCVNNLIVRINGGEFEFKGFMIQGRVVADDSTTGTFAVSGVNYQA